MVYVKYYLYLYTNVVSQPILMQETLPAVNNRFF